MADILAGRRKNPWAIEFGRLREIISAASSIEERGRAQTALRDHCDTRFSPVVSQAMLAEQMRQNAIADGQR